MGLFGNDKKPCPICGNATPRLFATKIEGVPICGSCADLLDLPAEKKDNLTLDSLRAYMDFYNENRELQKSFQESYKLDTSFFAGSAFVFDYNHKFFKCSELEKSLVFKGSEIKRVTVSEDHNVIFELTRDGLTYKESSVKDTVFGMSATIAEFNRRRETYEHLMRVKQAMEHKQDPNGNRQSNYNSQLDPERPEFRQVGPFERFHVHVEFEHDWWDEYHYETDGVRFDSREPSIEGYISTYERQIEQYRELMMAFRTVVAPDSKVSNIGKNGSGSQQVAQVSMGGADELLKYKQLLDAGLLTMEEFNQKKCQILQM